MTLVMTQETPVWDFSALGLPPAIVEAVRRAGYERPTAVQCEAIPPVLAGEDVLVSAPTGGGKTAAFALPLLARLMTPRPRSAGRGARVLVLVPTRELAQQVEKAFRTYGSGLRRLSTALLVGGVAFGPQRAKLAGFVDVIVATPGRLRDHLEQRTTRLDDVQALVLDEADRMLDMGFIDDIRAIAAQTPAARQTLLFSATLDGVVGQLAASLTRDAVRVRIEPTEAVAPKIEERWHRVDDLGHKHRVLEHLLRTEVTAQAVIFTATKRSAEELAQRLQDQGIAAAALHGDMTQRARTRTVEQLRRGEVQVLVATDVAARGLDVAGISHVVNFDLPKQHEDYVHRIGRTGRAGRAGVAVTLAHGFERRTMDGIARYLGREIPEAVIPGLEPQPLRTGGGRERRFGTRRREAERYGERRDYGRGSERGDWARASARREGRDFRRDEHPRTWERSDEARPERVRTERTWDGPLSRASRWDGSSERSERTARRPRWGG